MANNQQPTQQPAPQQATEAAPDDRTARIADLNKQINALVEERDRLMGGAE